MNNQYFNNNYMYPPFNTYNDDRYVKEQRFVIADEALLKGNIEKNAYKPYRNYSLRLKEPVDDKERLLLKIQKNGFAMLESCLCLDTCPEDQDVLKAFIYYRQETEKLVNEYERKYGPLKLCSMSNDQYPWSWIKGPWPWEGRK